MTLLALQSKAPDKCTQAATHFKNGQYDHAAALLGEALLENQTSDRWNDWATAKFFAKRAAEAENGYRRALEMEPENIQAATNLGVLLATLGRAEEAIPLLEKAAVHVDDSQRAMVTQLLKDSRAKLASAALAQPKAAIAQPTSDPQKQMPTAATAQANGTGVDPLSQQRYWEQMMQTARYADEKRLLRFGAKAYSQSEEDGIIAEIFRRIGSTNRTYIEFGVGAGLENNTLALLMSGWRGLWIEANASDVEAARAKLGSQLESRQLRIENQFVTRETIDALLKNACPSPEPDLLCIDVDGNDYWIWEAIHSLRPRVVAIEYNASWFPPLSLTIHYQEKFQWDGSNYFGASLKALELLGARKGYKLVGCNFSGVNAFFVREDLCEDKFCTPYTAENHFEPPRYWMVRAAGHPPGAGPIVQIAASS
jgi:tetratricopeptide (TPR) repeat protein